MGGGAAAAPAPMVVRAALKAKPPVPGELRLSASAGVEFAPADGSAARVVPLAALSRCLLKGDKPLMKVEALEGSGAAGLVLAFDGLGGRDAAAEAVNALLAYRRAEQGEAPPQPSGKPKKARARVATQAELALRKAVLLRDAHLRRLHTELVQGGLVSDEAFWAASGRQAVLEAEAARAGGAAERQLRGSASAMLARDAFGTIEGGSTGQHGGRVRYRLTKDVKAQIFRERPAVRKAFVAVVPAKMSEKDFWEKFCRAEYFAKRAARTGGTAAAAAAEAARAAGPTDDPTDPEADVALFAVSDEQRDLERTRAMQRLEDTNAALNMAADAAEELPAAFGTARGGLLEPSAALTAATRPAEATDAAAGATGGMASQINRHGDVVMRGHEAALDGLADNADTAAIARAIESDENGAAHRGVSVGATHKHALEARERGDPLVQSAADVVISDLVDKPEPIVDELKFANPFKKRKLHQVGASEVASGRPAAVERAAKGGPALNGDTLAEMRDSLQHVTTRAPDAPPLEDPQAALQILTTVSKQIAGEESARVSPLDKLPPELRSHVAAKIQLVKEVLKHFWGVFGSDAAPKGLAKSRGDKLEAKMRELSDAIMEERRSAPVDHRPNVAAAYQHAIAMLDAGFERYDRLAEQAKHGA